jgi:large subunit ribosomal protein L30
MQKTLKVTLKKSKYGRIPKHAATLKGLGLGRVNKVRELLDTPEVRGMINSVSHLVEVIEVKK